MRSEPFKNNWLISTLDTYASIVEEKTDFVFIFRSCCRFVFFFWYHIDYFDEYEKIYIPVKIKKFKYTASIHVL